MPFLESLLAWFFHAVVLAHQMIWIIENLRRGCERDPMELLVLPGLGWIPGESHFCITVLYLFPVDARGGRFLAASRDFRYKGRRANASIRTGMQTP
jgi:hypothetical protein